MKTLEDRFGQPKFVIEGLLTKARAAPSPSVTKPEATIKFGIAVQELVASITSYKSSQYLYSIEILSTLVKKMSIEMETEWYTWLRQDTSREENLKYFSQWISIKQSVAYLVSTLTTASENTNDKDRKKKQTNLGTVSTNPKPDRKGYCVYCKIENHYVSDCRKFSALPIKEEDEFVKKNRMCFRCLKKNHTVKNCKLRMTCKVEGCRGRYHTSLHDNSRFDEVQENGEAILQDQSKSQPPSAPPATHMHCHQGSAVTDTDDEVEETLLWYAPVQLKGTNGTTISVIAMFDTGAQKTLILEKNVKKLSIDGKWRDLSLGWFNGQDNTDPSMTTRIEISGDFSNAKTYILKCHTVSVMNLPSQTYSAAELKKKYPYLRRAPFPSLKNATPSLIIGNDNISLILSRDYIEQSPDLPIAVKTKLGWTLAGNGEMLTGGKQGNFSIFTRKKTNNEDLSEVMSDFIAAEDCTTFKSATPMSKEDVETLKVLEETTIKKQGCWETSLLWENDVLPVLSSEEMVRKRLLTMESKADKDPAFAKVYTTPFEEYISAGFLQKVKVYPNEKEDKRWYLPHLIAFHPSKKPRLVFDVAAKSKGKSFNDFVYTGPDLLQKLAAVFMRFRRHRFAISGDIKQMFHQVAPRRKDRPAQTLLYRGMDGNREPDSYEMSVLFFGWTCSPTSAIYAKDLNAKEHINQYPAVVNSIIKDTYIYDFLSGAKTEKQALQMQKKVRMIHENGGFPVVKWRSNSVKVTNAIPSELLAEGTIQISLKSDLGIEKTLGIFWDQVKDCFIFELDTKRIPKYVLKGHRNQTKCQLASFIMSIFDSLGFLTPLKVKGIIGQLRWKFKVDWDDQVPYVIDIRFKDWLEELRVSPEFEVLRFYDVDLSMELQLHIFCDASEEAFALVAYVRGHARGSLRVSIIAGKGKVAWPRISTLPTADNSQLEKRAIINFIHEREPLY
ncbi:uncharacterized protein LOC126890201 [Diabrotica virgifera virgifera]|uniref:CCHC-type domain-containing protein n=1 Tax=Diabrotica virgifera virgifera TaxID=50390 RepID=A0ABM5KXT8_DIAVI|nr:uncharacterized protein LOC126890201 [Diabrotica virgifera virgifera]